MFDQLKKQVSDTFNSMSKDQSKLFHIEVDRDKVFEIYLSGFTDEVRQSHNCNCCKSFLRQFSGVVAIKDNKVVSIWDFPIESIDEEYRNSVQLVRDYVKSLPIHSVFINTFAGLGTDKNHDTKRDVIWTHFHVKLPSNLVYNGDKDSVDTKKAEARSKKEVFKRALDELTIDSISTVLDLIAQNSLYKGPEYEHNLKSFLSLKSIYTQLPEDKKDAYAWINSVTQSDAICKIRGTSIGQLLISLSEGMELDVAVGKFEAMVAPTNYKRPTALVTPRMVEAAKTRLTELGLMDSLDRKYATSTDISIDKMLFVDRSSELTDIFNDMQKEVLVNPKTFSKIEEVNIKDFVEKILPTAKSVEVLVENIHLSNFVSLITAQNPNSPSMFKWNNPFSWSYTGGITDSIKERVKAAGGKVDGVLRFSIQWNDDGKNNIDFDAHAIEPDGNHIYYGSSSRKPGISSMSGQLDVDIVNPGGKVAVENITWADSRKMKDGTYRFYLKNYSSSISKGGFSAEVEFNGESHIFEYGKNLRGNEEIQVAEVTLIKGLFTIKNLLDSKTSVVSKDKWNIKTNQFQKVKNIMLSPNHWDSNVGNKHYMFMLENCICDEIPRPFFNEFLKEELTTDRKVFEVMGSKLKVAQTESQLSGIGFSDTQRNHLIVRLEGTFKRTIKVVI